MQREGKPVIPRELGPLAFERSPLPSPTLPVSPLSARTIRFAEQRSHLRQRSSTSGTVLGIASPPSSARSTGSTVHEESTTVVIEVPEPRGSPRAL